MKVASAEFIRSAFSPLDFARDGRPEVSFVGRSNVGKSALLNRLLGRKSLARVSQTPGRTRAVNYFLVNGRFYCVDLPGYGFAKASRKERQAWSSLVETYLSRTAPRDQTVMLVDSKVGATELDLKAFEYLTSKAARVTLAATKIDRLPAGRRGAALAAIRRALAAGDGTALIPVSATTGEGVGELWREIETRLATTAAIK